MDEDAQLVLKVIDEFDGVLPFRQGKTRNHSERVSDEQECI